MGLAIALPRAITVNSTGAFVFYAPSTQFVQSEHIYKYLQSKGCRSSQLADIIVSISVLRRNCHSSIHRSSVANFNFLLSLLLPRDIYSNTHFFRSSCFTFPLSSTLACSSSDLGRHNISSVPAS
jgi:hypothetical protein